MAFLWVRWFGLCACFDLVCLLVVIVALRGFDAEFGLFVNVVWLICGLIACYVLFVYCWQVVIIDLGTLPLGLCF